MKLKIIIIVLAALAACSGPSRERGENLIYSLGSVVAEKDGMYAVADTAGFLLSGYTYQELEGLPGNFLMAKSDGTAFILDCNGNKVSKEYEEIEYCFNGCAIVLEGGKKGMIKPDGTELLQPGYREISFFAQGLAAAQMCSYTDVVDMDGRLLARVYGGLQEVYGQAEKFVKMRRERLSEEELYWNRILDEYDSLCNRSLEVKELLDEGGVLQDGYMESLVQQAENIKGMLKESMGKMTAKQLERYGEIKRKYGI